MCKFGRTSKFRLNSCCSNLQMLMNVAIVNTPIDFSVIQGYRGQELQDLYFERGKSQVKFPSGNHNKIPSLAVDIVPYPIDWLNIDRFKILHEHILKVAKKLRIEIVWGGDWSFKDYVHYELKL